MVIKTNPAEFLRFHSLLIREAPMGYYPFYLILEPDGKNPLSEISWTKKGKTAEEAVRFLKFGYNVGIAAMPDDPLVIADVDDPTQVGEIKETLQAISSKQIGNHNYYFAADASAKVNIACDDAGEIRASGQYVVTPGSFVTRSKEEIARMPEKRKQFAGMYLLANELPVSKITFSEFPEVYKLQAKKDAKNEEEKAVKREKITHVKNKNRSALWDLTIYDVLGLRDSNRNFPIPVQFHGSDTGKNASVSNGLLHCWRHSSFHTGRTALAVLAGVASCNEASIKHKNGNKVVRRGSLVDFSDPEVQFKLWMHAYQHGMLPAGDKIPAKALKYYAESKGIARGVTH
jgi:putative DNA primase/helicase